MPKILYIWKGAYPWDVRVEKFCRAFIEAGMEVLMLARWTGEENRSEIIDGIQIERVGFGKPKTYSIPVSPNPFWKAAIKHSVQSFKPDLIIAREIMLAEASADIGHKYNIPVIMDMAEHYPAAMKQWDKYKKSFIKKISVHKLNIPEKFERNSVRKIDFIITVCEEQNLRLLNQYFFPIERTKVIHNVPERKFFKNVRKGISETKLVLGHHGFMSEEKNLDMLLNAFIKVAIVNKDIKLILAGDGQCYSKLNIAARNSDVGDRITLTGKYNYSELPNILSKIDIGVIPYSLNEFNQYTIHNKVFDFFATAKPVLVTPSKPLVRLIKETNAGIVLSDATEEAIAEAILNLDMNLLKQYSENSLKAFELKYNWQSEKKDLINFVISII